MDGPAAGPVALEEEDVVVVDMWADAARLGGVADHAVFLGGGRE